MYNTEHGENVPASFRLINLSYRPANTARHRYAPAAAMDDSQSWPPLRPSTLRPVRML